MLMIQMMWRYEDNLQERNGLTGTGWHYMVANGLESEWQVGPIGPGNGV
jgi:hypothetical protein